MIDYHCNSCGHDGQLPDDLSGQVGRCPLCDSFLRAPGQPTPEGTDRRLLLFEDPAGWFLPSHLRNAARHAYTPGFYKVLFVAWTGGFFVLLALLPLKLSPDNEAKYAAAAAWRERVLPALGLDPSGSPWVHLAWGAATLVVVWIGDRARRDRVLDVYDSCSGGEPDGDLVGFAGAGGIDVLFWGPFLAFWLVFGLFLATHALPTVRPVPLLRGPWTFVVAVAVAGHVLTVALARRLIRARFGARRPRQAPPRSAPPSPHTGRVYICRLSPDGRWVASGSDGVACLQDAATEQECAVFHGHTGAVVAVAFTPDARSLASGGLDDRVRLWSVPARSPAGALPVASPPHDLVFTPDQAAAGWSPLGAPAGCWRSGTSGRVSCSGRGRPARGRLPSPRTAGCWPPAARGATAWYASCSTPAAGPSCSSSLPPAAPGCGPSPSRPTATCSPPRPATACSWSGRSRRECCLFGGPSPSLWRTCASTPRAGNYSWSMPAGSSAGRAATSSRCPDQSRRWKKTNAATTTHSCSVRK
jgi:hypothetical protein